MYNNTISGTATEKGGNENILEYKTTCTINYLHEKGGNDNIITV